jgi:sugar-specific transcriptional regulator TrmB
MKLGKSVKNFLVDFGLTDKEILVYTTLLKTGPNTIMNLARETDIKRSTTHNTVEELIKKGLVSQTNYGERRMVIAEDPDKLKFLMEQKKWDIVKLEKNLPDVIKSIYEAVPNSKENTKVEVKYYQGQKEVKYVYDLSLKADEVYSFVNLDKYYEVFPGTGELFVKALENNPNRKVWDIAVDSPLAREIAKSHGRYYCKYIPSSKIFSGMDILIFDDKTAIIQLNKENTIATIIDSVLITESLKALHQSMWGLIT